MFWCTYTTQFKAALFDNKVFLGFVSLGSIEGFTFSLCMSTSQNQCKQWLNLQPMSTANKEVKLDSSSNVEYLHFRIMLAIGYIQPLVATALVAATPSTFLPTNLIWGEFGNKNVKLRNKNKKT